MRACCLMTLIQYPKEYHIGPTNRISKWISRWITRYSIGVSNWISVLISDLICSSDIRVSSCFAILIFIVATGFASTADSAALPPCSERKRGVGNVYLYPPPPLPGRLSCRHPARAGLAGQASQPASSSWNMPAKKKGPGLGGGKVITGARNSCLSLATQGATKPQKCWPELALQRFVFPWWYCWPI